VVRQTVEGRQRIATLAERCSLATLPSSTNFVLVDAGSPPRAQALLDELLRRGVFVQKPMAPPLDRCVRITVGTSADLDALEPIFEEAVGALA